MKLSGTEPPLTDGFAHSGAASAPLRAVGDAASRAMKRRRRRKGGGSPCYFVRLISPRAAQPRWGALLRPRRVGKQKPSASRIVKPHVTGAKTGDCANGSVRRAAAVRGGFSALQPGHRALQLHSVAVFFFVFFIGGVWVGMIEARTTLGCKAARLKGWSADHQGAWRSLWGEV